MTERSGDDKGDAFERHPPSATEAASDGDLTPARLDLDVQTPVASGEARATAPPSSPLGVALATLPAAVAAIGWMLAAGWTFGRAIPLRPDVAALLALVPAVALLVAAPYSAHRRTRAAEKAAEAAEKEKAAKRAQAARAAKAATSATGDSTRR